MGAALELEHRVGPVTLDREGHLFEAANLGGALGDRLGAEAPLLGVATEHVVEVARKEGGLVAAGPGPDLDNHVLVVVGVAFDHRQADLLRQLLEPGRSRGDDRAQLLVLANLGQHLGRALEVIGELAVLASQRPSGLESAILAAELGVALAVRDHRGISHIALELGEPPLDLLNKLGDHRLGR